MRRIFAFLIAILLPLPALAASGAPALYEVQVLVFANHIHHLDGGEQWEQDPNPVIRGLHHALDPSHGLPPGSPLLAAEERLTGHPRYTVLAARSWVQNAVTLRKTRAVRIKSRHNGHLNGVVRVFQWRLLHVSLDLRYHHEGLLGGTNAPVFRLIQNRPVALNRVNYFDNPKFGVLVLVTRYHGEGTLQPHTLSR
ncbi:MAG: CsiV family protein [Gammaproteobacteria bacterium]|nr:CsiV family protein [Gammaproteobacteria bacterium]